MNPISDCRLLDCRDGMKQHPDKFFDLAIVDPPYGIGEDGRNHLARVLRKDGTHVRRKDKRTGNQMVFRRQDYNISSRYDDMPPGQSFFDELFRVSKRQIIWGENYLSFSQKGDSSGRIIWDKVNGSSDQSDCEIAWVSFFSSVRMVAYMWNGMMQAKSLAEPRTQQPNKRLNEKRIHPNHKPIALYSWLLDNFAKPGDKILDTHLGGGSSRIAAYKRGFDFWGFEIDEEHFRAAEQRFKEEVSMPLFDPPESDPAQLQIF